MAGQSIKWRLTNQQHKKDVLVTTRFSQRETPTPKQNKEGGGENTRGEVRGAGSSGLLGRTKRKVRRGEVKIQSGGS